MGCLDYDSSYKQLDRVRAAVDAMVLSCIILGNSFIIFAVALNWKRQGMSTSNKSSTLLVINLSVADMFVGIFNMYYFLPRYFCDLSHDLSNNFMACILSFSLVIIPYLASGYTLIAISVDRYLAIVHPSRYCQLLNSRRTLAILALIWTVAIVASFQLIFWNNWRSGEGCTMMKVFPLPLDFILGLLDIVVFTIVTVTLYCRIQQVIHQQQGKFRKQDRRSANALLIILVVYIMSWVPFTVLQISYKMGVPVPSLSLELTSSFANVNFLANPFIYAYNDKPVKKAVMRTLGIFDWRNVSTPAKQQLSSNIKVTTSSPMSYDELKQWPNNCSQINR